MARIGVLIETKDGQVRKTTLGILTLARQDPEGKVYALLLDPCAEGCRESLKEYGADRIVAIQTPEAEIASFPEGQAAVLVSAIDHFQLDILLGSSGLAGRDLLARVASLKGGPWFWIVFMSILPREWSGNPTSPAGRRRIFS